MLYIYIYITGRSLPDFASRCSSHPFVPYVYLFVIMLLVFVCLLFVCYLFVFVICLLFVIICCLLFVCYLLFIYYHVICLLFVIMLLVLAAVRVGTCRGSGGLDSITITIITFITMNSITIIIMDYK